MFFFVGTILPAGIISVNFLYLLPELELFVPISGILDISDIKVTIGVWQFYQFEGGVSMADTFVEVKEIIVDLLGVDESKVTPEARFREDLEADSLDLVELIMAFEDKFGGEISDEDAQTISTVGEAVTYIDDRMVKEG